MLHKVNSNNELTILDCDTSAAEMANKIIRQIPSVLEKTLCESCGRQGTDKATSIMIEMTDVKNYLVDAIEREMRPNRDIGCSLCDAKVTRTYEINGKETDIFFYVLKYLISLYLRCSMM